MVGFGCRGAATGEAYDACECCDAGGCENPQRQCLDVLPKLLERTFAADDLGIILVHRPIITKLETLL